MSTKSNTVLSVLLMAVALLCGFGLPKDSSTTLANLVQPCRQPCPIVLSSGNKEIQEQSTRQSWSTFPTGKLTSPHNETIADIRGWQVMVMLLFELTCGEVETPTVFTSTST